jgi:hypothetical protein
MSQIILNDKYKAFLEALPQDIRRKLSFHDIRRIFKTYDTLPERNPEAKRGT